MNIKIYRIASLVLGPVIDIYMQYRKKIGKEDPKRFDERLGKANFPRPQGSLIWIHAASIGEAISVLPLIERITKDFPSINVLLTTGTVTSSNLLEKKLPKNVIHQFVPVDKFHAVKRFLSHWKPDCAIWVESEIWPNLVYETHSTGCPLILVNARMSVSSYEKWKKLQNFSKNILSCFSLCIAQTEEDKDRFEKIGAKKVVLGGNLKYEAPSLPADPAETGKLINMISDRPIWLAASTNKGEEEMIAFVHKKIVEKHPNLLTIIIPRHPERQKEVSNILKDEGINISIRSKNEDIETDTSIYVADTVGEMGIFYRLCGIVFMGGSLIEHGGQNPLEAARLECAILSGPNTHNFKSIYKELESVGGVLVVKDAADLAMKVDEIIRDHDKQETLAQNAFEFIEGKKGMLNEYVKLLSPYLNPLHKVSNIDTSKSIENSKKQEDIDEQKSKIKEEISKN